MRPSAIMASSAIVALLIGLVILAYLPRTAAPPAAPVPPPRNPEGNQFPSSPPSGTTIEYPGGIEVTGGVGGWDLTCVAVLTAPKTMQVEAVSQVVTTILTATGKAVGPLLEAAQQTADAINQGARSPKHDPATGLDPGSAGAIRQLIANNGVRQADVSSFPAAPVLTAHLTGPGFKITPQTPNPQPVGLGATTTWSWAIEAVDPGSQILTVSYEAEVQVAGQKIPKTFRTITRTITVSVAPRDFIKRLADDSSSAKTIADNVSWIWTTMIFPAGMFVYGLLKWLRGRNASPRSSQS
jgi:hypothetical protein